jgi:glutathione S-transferase
MRFKNIPFKETIMTGYELMVSSKKWTGASVMPILKTPEGNYLQDTWDIIRALEIKHPQPPLIPLTPRKRFVSLFIEAWADEFWVPFAMHYRWNFPESVEFFKTEAGDSMFPAIVPRFIKQSVANNVASTLVSFLPVVGVRPDQTELIHSWTLDILGKLNDHFAVHQFVLGNLPSTADCALAGPLVAHLGRDPWPRDNLIPQFPHVQSWIERMKNPDFSGFKNEGADSDDIPDTLRPVLQSALQEFVPMLEATAVPVSAVCNNEKFNSGSKPLPRRLGDITSPLLNMQYKKAAIPFVIWKAQCVIDDIQSMTPNDYKTVSEYMQSYSGNYFDKLLNLSVPRLERVDVRVKYVPP